LHKICFHLIPRLINLNDLECMAIRDYVNYSKAVICQMVLQIGLVEMSTPL